MAVKTYCNNPQQLLNKIKAGIRAGSIKTWTLDTDGDLTHATQQWKNKAWFRPSLQQGLLLFNILGPQGAAMSTEIYAIYHGRLIEMLLAHFDADFTNAAATNYPVSGDFVGGGNV
jgi:hypothetical protein